MPEHHLHAIETVIFSSPIVRVGIFRCPVSYPLFTNTGRTSDHLLVFPRTCVQITHAGRRAVVADPNRVMVYNRDQSYERAPLSERGDLCEWFAFDPALLRDALRPADPSVDEHPDQPFGTTHAASEPHVYLAQRLVVQYLQNQQTIDRLFVEERLLAVLAHVVAAIQQAAGREAQQRQPTRANDTRLLADAAQQLIALRFHEPLSLEYLARLLAISPFHLARCFYRHIGHTIHAYLNRIRLSTALEQVAQHDTDLARIGVDLGYSSHSHFSTAFQRMFGLSPSAFRMRASAQRMSEMRNILKA